LFYELPSFEHVDVNSIKEAVSWLYNHDKQAKVIAGGTDLLGLMKDRVVGAILTIPEVLINIKGIPEMNSIIYDEKDVLRVGATATLSQLLKSDIIKNKFNVLWSAARQIGTTQLRNMATIGGNICQRPQCMYFRHPHFACYKKGGSKCYAITGENRDYHSILKYGRCVMAHPSDMATVLVALDAKAIIVGYEGEKQIPLKRFFLGPNNPIEIILKTDELLTHFQVPNLKGKNYQVFLKHRIRSASDFSLSSVAAVAEISDGTCGDIRIVLGGIAPFPYIASGAEKIVRGKRLNEKLILKAGAVSVKGARPLSMNRYKIELTKVLVTRALRSIWKKAADVLV
jgi:xanthine dehydrogenase YagS FAD-binding subunit